VIAVDLGRQWLEPYLHAVAVAVAIIGRKIAQDAVLDAVALGLHADRLGDIHARVRVDADVAVKIKDAFRGADARARDREKNEQQYTRYAPIVHNFTGSVFSAWKKSCSRKPNGFAISSAGKFSMC